MSGSETKAPHPPAAKNPPPGSPPPALSRRTPAPAVATAPRKSPETTDDRAGAGMVVYITKSGKCYHRLGCHHLRKGGIQTTLRDAKKNGYTPCSSCKPPG